jgi:hypothetical protein
LVLFVRKFHKLLSFCCLFPFSYFSVCFLVIWKLLNCSFCTHSCKQEEKLKYQSLLLFPNHRFNIKKKWIKFFIILIKSSSIKFWILLWISDRYWKSDNFRIRFRGRDGSTSIKNINMFDYPLFVPIYHDFCKSWINQFKFQSNYLAFNCWNYLWNDMFVKYVEINQNKKSNLVISVKPFC